jgi:hypothetical protein
MSDGSPFSKVGPVCPVCNVFADVVRVQSAVRAHPQLVARNLPVSYQPILLV